MTVAATGGRVELDAVRAEDAGAADDIVHIPADQFEELLHRVERAEYRAEQTSRTPFKTGGYGMMNRPWMWRFGKGSTLPDWMRLALYCWAHHRKDGHCPVRGDFGPTVLGKRMTSSNANKWINRAVAEGALGEQSNTRCLVAPWGVRYGTTADVWSDCGMHGRSR